MPAPGSMPTARDRSTRTRPAGDNDRRVRQKRQQNTRQHSILTPTAQVFFEVAYLNKRAPVGDWWYQALDKWDALLGRRAASPETRGTHLSVYYDQREMAEILRDLKAAGAPAPRRTHARPAARRPPLVPAASSRRVALRRAPMISRDLAVTSSRRAPGLHESVSRW